MNIAFVFWIALTVFTLVIAVVLAIAIFRSPQKPTTSTKAIWLAAASISGMVLFGIGTKVSELIPHATVVDVGALAITGVLTGIFLALGLQPLPKDKTV